MKIAANLTIAINSCIFNVLYAAGWIYNLPDYGAIYKFSGKFIIFSEL